MRNPVLSFPVLVAIAALSACGPEHRPPAPAGWVVIDDPEPATRRVAPSPGGSEPTPYVCELESAHTSMTYWVEPRFAAFTPNGGLFVANADYGGGGTTLAVHDGDGYEANDRAGLAAVDSTWRRGLFMQPYGQVEVRTLADAELLWSWRAERPVLAASLSPQGRHVAVASCDGEATELELADLDTGVRRVTPLDLPTCYAWGPALRKAAFTEDSRYLVIVVEATLLRVDVETLAVAALTPHADPDGEDWYQTVIASFALRPGADEVVTTGVDGFLRRWSLESLEQLGADRTVGVARINEMTYAPHYDVSPVAYSPDGATLAFMNTEGDIVLSNAAGDTVLPAPPVDPAHADWSPTANVPVMIAFSPAGDRLGVGYYYGPAIWGCPGAPRGRAGTLAVRARTPQAASLYAEVAIPIEIDSAEPLTALRLTGAAGEAYSFWYADGAVRFWPGTAGPLELVVEVHDGTASAATTVRVDVADPP